VSPTSSSPRRRGYANANNRDRYRRRSRDWPDLVGCRGVQVGPRSQRGNEVSCVYPALTGPARVPSTARCPCVTCLRTNSALCGSAALGKSNGSLPRWQNYGPETAGQSVSPCQSASAPGQPQQVRRRKPGSSTTPAISRPSIERRRPTPTRRPSEGRQRHPIVDERSS
jgi:hypothetical protein